LTAGAIVTKDIEGDQSGEPQAVPPPGQEMLPFNNDAIRKTEHSGEWQFSIVDIVGVLIGGTRARKYWSDLKRKLIVKEGFSELSDKIGQLPMAGVDGKHYPTDVANTETILRIIQSIPSPRVEPLKRWLAAVGYERIQESQDPELAIKRAIATYQARGRTDDWIEKRLRSIVARKELTNEWKSRGIEKGQDYAALTNIISMETFGGISPSGHKALKGLAKTHNLRDHMTDLELIFTMLAEKSTTEIAKARDAQHFRANADAARSGARVAGEARVRLETEIKQPIISTKNHLNQRERISDPVLLTKKRDGA
jgi:DNA-damage-inducible protein D